MPDTVKPLALHKARAVSLLVRQALLGTLRARHLLAPNCRECMRQQVQRKEQSALLAM